MRETYILRGHGGTERKWFILGKDQYVIFPTRCGYPSSISTTTSSKKLLGLITNVNKMYKFMRGEINKKNYPKAFHNARILGPGNTVSNSILSMKNTSRFPYDPERSKVHKWFHSTTGVFKVRGNDANYIFGRGNTRHISSLIGKKPGVYYVDACRVLPGMTQNKANTILRKIIKGERNINVPKTSFIKSIQNYENRMALKKRKRESLTLRKIKNEQERKRIRLNNISNIIKKFKKLKLTSS